MAKPAKEVAYLTPENVELFLRKLVTAKLAETSDAAGALLGGGHLMIARLRKRGGTYAEALAMTAVLNGLEPFSAETVKGEELVEIPATPSGHALIKAEPKKRETSAEMRARMEAELRAQIEAELRAKYGITDEEPAKEPVAA